jgi:L-fuconolactonase
MKIDSHQHFWHYDERTHDWITPDMAVIRRNFQPADLAVEYAANGIDGCVAVQAEQTEAENGRLIEMAAGYSFIKGVVGWIDLQAKNIEDRLQYYNEIPIIKGFRHVLQSETQRDFMLSSPFMHGIGKLQSYNYTYDLLIFPDQLEYSNRLVASFPNQKFVLDHIAKPSIKSGDIDQWKKEIRKIAAHPNLFCKVSGMVTEADWKIWTAADLKPYLDVVVEAFGPGRLMFGSDWPVCLVAATYRDVLGVVVNYFSSFSDDEKRSIFGLNAARFYNLEVS